MRINEERLLWVRLIVLRVCRHDAQAATGGRTGIRVFLDLGHATADEVLFGTMLERSTHEAKKMKMQRRTVCTRAERRCATRTKTREERTSMRDVQHDSREEAQEEKLSQSG